MRSFATLAALVAAASAAPSLRPRHSDPVCVVGAGPAGLATAKALEGKGHRTVLFEKRLEVGGKCQSYYENGAFHPLGAVLYTPETYTETRKIIASTGVSSSDFNTGVAWDYDWKTGSLAVQPPRSNETIQAIGAEYARYSLFWQTTFAPLSSVGFKNGVPAEFAVPAQEWLLANDFQYLSAVITNVLVTYGYGDYRRTPLLYVLQFLNPEVLGQSLGIIQGYKIDFHEMFVRFAKTLNGPIKLGAKIRSIDRNSSRPTITYTTGGHHIVKTQQCSSLVLAFPPTLRGLEATGLDLTPEERTLFGEVGVENYYGSAVKMTRMTARDITFHPTTVNPITPPEAEGQPILFTPLHEQSDVVSAWSWDSWGSPIDEDKSRRLLVETLSKFNKDPTNAAEASVPLTEADIKGWSGWTDYFPHVETQALVDGWYQKFNALQGRKKTFFASGLNCFETVEFALRAGYDVVAEHF